MWDNIHKQIENRKTYHTLLIKTSKMKTYNMMRVLKALFNAALASRTSFHPFTRPVQLGSEYTLRSWFADNTI